MGQQWGEETGNPSGLWVALPVSIALNVVSVTSGSISQPFGLPPQNWEPETFQAEANISWLSRELIVKSIYVTA